MPNQLPTIETCFNCFGTRSSDAKIIQRRQQNPQNSKFTQNHLDTPSPSAGEKGGLSKMARAPEGDTFKKMRIFNCMVCLKQINYNLTLLSSPHCPLNNPFLLKFENQVKLSHQVESFVDTEKYIHYSRDLPAKWLAGNFLTRTIGYSKKVNTTSGSEYDQARWSQRKLAKVHWDQFCKYGSGSVCIRIFKLNPTIDWKRKLLSKEGYKNHQLSQLCFIKCWHFLKIYHRSLHWNKIWITFYKCASMKILFGRAGHVTSPPRQRDHVFRPQHCLLLHYVYIHSSI